MTIKYNMRKYKALYIWLLFIYLYIKLNIIGRVVMANPERYPNDWDLNQGIYSIIFLPLGVSGHTSFLQNYRNYFEMNPLILCVLLLLLIASTSLLIMHIHIIKRRSKSYQETLNQLERDNEKLVTENQLLSAQRDAYSEQVNAIKTFNKQETDNDLLTNKSQYIANTSHEIKTFINGIYGMLQLIAMTELSNEQKEYIEISKMAVNSLLHGINNILNYSKIEAGKLVLESREFDLQQLFDEIRGIYLYTANAKGIDFEISMEESCSHVLVGDGFRLREILFNLIGNALKYTESGTIKVYAEELARLGSNKIQLRFSVKDTGIGIKEDQIDNIFKCYEQASDDIYRLYGGTGLGLSIVKDLVERMDGSIGVNSQLDQGSEFYFTAIFSSNSNREQVPRLQGLGGMKVQKKVKLLIVDDDSVARFIMKSFCELNHWEVDIVDNGKKALAHSKVNHYDVILMDLEMSVMNGYETTKAIHALETDYTPIIAITAHSLQKEKEKCLEYGMDDFISKPIDLEEFSRIIKRWI